MSDQGTPTWTAAEETAMRRALELAATPGVPTGPNPRVGCVLLDDDGRTVAEGFHRGAGSAHAEVDALTAAGDRARGATAVVTLEPCNHTGRTGPCAQALIAAGVRRVVHAQRDPNPDAAGGAETLRVAGIEVVDGLLADDAHDRPLPHQPLRAVMGLRDLAPDRRVLDDQAETVHLRTRDPHLALQALRERDRQHVFLEGGPTLAAAFVHEGLVDEVVVYVAPFLLGAGRQAVADLGITTIADAWRPRVVDLTVLEPVVDGEEPNVRLTLEPPSSVEVRAQRATRPHREDH